MNGAESLVRTLVGGGIEICFANPGTSEMHFVAALDRVEGMRPILALFEGVVTGAADGYGRMAEKPAATLLHLGPGLANGSANLHNATKASTPIVNIVGDHATGHRKYDAPLTSDVEGTARPFSRWVKTSPEARLVARDGAAAIVAARTSPGGVATLILPADTAWNEADGPAEVPPIPAPSLVSASAVDAAARVLRSGEPTLILLGHGANRGRALELAGRIPTATGARLMFETFDARMHRGAGRVTVDRVPYPVAPALEALAPYRHVVLVGSKQPVAFFAYPDRPSVLTAPGAEMHVLAARGEDETQALEALADALGCRTALVPAASLDLPPAATGAITPAALGQSLAALMPDQAILIDESVTTGEGLWAPTRRARPHDWLTNMGGSIGFGLPVGTGAAIACPDRQVICLESDGSAMYTIQALWTQARESLKVLTLLFANRSYNILRNELANVGARNAGPKALSMLALDRPELGFAAIARGMGVPASRVETMAEFNRAFAAGLATEGPYLVEIML